VGLDAFVDHLDGDAHYPCRYGSGGRSSRGGLVRVDV
jgi:hypothetical protein